MILKKKVRGPCWINFLNFKPPTQKLSYCSYEYEIPSMEFMKVDKDKAHIPNLKLASLSCAFAKNTDTGVQEIVALSAVTVDNYDLENQNKEKSFGGFSCVRPFHSHIIPYGFDKS